MDILKVLKPNIIDRYLISEFLKPFLFTLFALTLILIGNYIFEVADLIFSRGIPIATLLQLIIYKIPDIMVESFAIAVLFATILAMSEMVKNNEFTAFRIGGIALHRVILPFIVISIIISLSSFFVNERVVPWANHEAENIVRRFILQEGLPELQEGVFFEGVEERHFYIGEIDEQKEELRDILVYEFESESSEYPRIIRAQRGRYGQQAWHLENGIIHNLNDEGEIVTQSSFDDLDISFDIEVREFYGEQRTTAEMSRAALKKEIELFQRSGLSVHSLVVDYHFKLANPFAALIFVLIGAPLSIKSDKGKVFGFITSILIIFTYYILVSVSRSLGRSAILPPLLAAWLPNLIFAVSGSIIILREQYLVKK